MNHNKYEVNNYLLRIYFLGMYRKLLLLSLLLVFLLILIGSIVRATGAGMGCPDWPKCFGLWVPPTSVEQLPIDYKEIFGAKLKGEVEFNAIKTWIEYLNRLFGVLVGIVTLLTAVFSLKFKKEKSEVTLYSFLALFFVIFAGWLGAKVVANELLPGLVTIHMLVALVVIFCLIKALVVLDFNGSSEHKSARFIVLLLGILSLGQLVLGTTVREQIDQLYLQNIQRSSWIDGLDGKYYLHIVLAFVILISNLWAFLYIKKQTGILNVSVLTWMIVLVILEFLIGGILGLFNLPAFAQPIHLTLASLIIGLQFYLFLIFGGRKI